MQQFTVTGMHCAACSASVEKAVKKVPGVESCAVSLLTNSMGIEGTAAPDAVIQAVQNAGYGASLRGQEASPAAAGTDALADHQTPHLKKRLICVRGLPARSDVFLDGPHDVGLAAAKLV